MNVLVTGRIPVGRPSTGPWSTDFVVNAEAGEFYGLIGRGRESAGGGRVKTWVSSGGCASPTLNVARTRRSAMARLPIRFCNEGARHS